MSVRSDRTDSLSSRSTGLPAVAESSSLPPCSDRWRGTSDRTCNGLAVASKRNVTEMRVPSATAPKLLVDQQFGVMRSLRSVKCACLHLLVVGERFFRATPPFGSVPPSPAPEGPPR